jgi:hypothetical protein
VAKPASVAAGSQTPSLRLWLSQAPARPFQSASATTARCAYNTGMRRSAWGLFRASCQNRGYARLTSRRMNSRITAPMKARMIDPIMPPPVEIQSCQQGIRQSPHRR